MVELLTARAVPQVEISRILNISEKTLRLRFRRQLDRGGAKLEAALVGNLLRIASGKDATALKAIRFALRARFGWTEYAPPPAKAPVKL